MFKMIAYHMQKRGRDLDESSTLTQQQNQSGQYPPQQPAPQQQQHQRAPFQTQGGQHPPQPLPYQGFQPCAPDRKAPHARHLNTRVRP